ncbi:unnamed protein product [Blumeria hordei]|uniref:PWWP domain-containing protein n=1 Tax=Blumeria hordei TaxID=2867405 RepID=A0A383UTE9_BLUHO|nr:unnamed protein product [Blumeria hordei]
MSKEEEAHVPSTSNVSMDSLQTQEQETIESEEGERILASDDDKKSTKLARSAIQESVAQSEKYNKKNVLRRRTQINSLPEPEDILMEDNRELNTPVSCVITNADGFTDSSVVDSKIKGRRKSTGTSEHRIKKPSKKATKIRTTHIDAKPGDYFYVRLKGYPLWPAIVCDETMLPSTLLKSRPVSAARVDGTYREDFTDGGPKAKDRSFPVMYLLTNEFGWIPNYDLLEIDFEEIANSTTTLRKDLTMARKLAAEKHDLNYFKDILRSFTEAREAERMEDEKIKNEKQIEKMKKKDIVTQKKTPKSSRKSKVTSNESTKEDEDASEAQLNVEAKEPRAGISKTRSKRPAEEILEEPPRKRTTIKLNTKTTIGNQTPSISKASDLKKQNPEKPTKPEKSGKPKKLKIPTNTVIKISKEPELSLEEKRIKKEKEILFLRHKLQKGLLTKDQELKIEEMKLMSEFIDKLEAYVDLEVSIIRQTKINKVLKAILKLHNIPMEEKYQFKLRSQKLLDEWNKLLANDTEHANTSVPILTNINENSESEAKTLILNEFEATPTGPEPENLKTIVHKEAAPNID